MVFVLANSTASSTIAVWKVLIYYLFVKFPPVEVYVAIGLLEADVKVVLTVGIFHFCLEIDIFLYATRRLDVQTADGRTLWTVESQDDGAFACCCCGELELSGTFVAEVYAAQTNVFTIVKVVDIHISPSG